MRLWRVTDGTLLASWSPPGKTFASGVFSRDGSRVAGAGSSGVIHVYDVESAAEIASLKAGVFVNSLTFALDGSRVAAACGDGALRVWDVDRGTLLHTLRADSEIAFFVDAAPDDRTLASVGLETVVRIWDAASGNPLRSIH